MKTPRLRTTLRMASQLGVLVVISMMYTNCGSFASSSGGVSSVGSQSLAGNTVTCDDATMQGIYQSGYYGFIRSHNCSLCHGTGGSGPSIGADDLSQAYSIFEISPGQFLDQTLNANAVDPTHHGAGTPSNQAAINTLATAWTSAVAANCKAASPVATTLGYDYALTNQNLNLSPGGSVALNWNLDSDVTPKSPVTATGATLSITVSAAMTGSVQAGYNISRVLITTGATGIKVSGAKVVINGAIYELGSTFVNSVADIPAGVANFPLSIGAIFIAMTPAATDTVALRLGDIAAPTIANNYQMASGTPITFTQSATFTQLTAPGGPFATYCVSCHNPVFKNGNLNVLDYTSVMQFVTPGLYSSHGDPESAMITLVEGSGANVMPPSGQGSDYNTFTTPLILWFNAGALNN